MANVVTASAQKAWSTSRVVLVVGLALAATMLATLALLFLQERDRAIAEQFEHNELYARVLEDHVTRSVDTAALSLATLAVSVADQGLGSGAMSPAALTQMLVSLPQLRAVAVLDLQGRVLGSSVPGETGQRVDLARLGRLPADGRDAIGAYVPGRGLVAVAGTGASGSAPGAVGFMPIVRRTKSRDGDRLVVGLIHPEGLATHMRLTIRDADALGLVAGFDGQVIASTAGPAPGASLAGLPVFHDYLPRVEHAAYRGVGVGGAEQALAFRVSGTRALVVIVQRPVASVLADWLEEARWRMLVAALAVLAVAGLTWTAARSVRAREQGRRSLDAAQAQVASSERELNIIVRSVQELLFRTDVDGELTFVNAHWTTASGQQVKDVLGERFSALARPQEQGAVRALFSRHTGSGVRTASCTLFWQAGAGRRFDVAVVPVYEGDFIVGFAGSAVDITERVQAERKLQVQLAFTAQLLDVSPLPSSVTDLAGHYVLVNKAWEDFTGRRREDVIGQPSGTHLNPELRAMNEQQDRVVATTGLPARYETKFPRHDGSMRDAVVNKLLVPGEGGAPRGILSTVVDVTEFREAERATRDARDAAEESSRAKSEFIANISHELRTPLQSIIGFSELGTLRGRGQDKLVAMFGDILASGRRMLALVNDLLDVSKIESSAGTIHLERADLRPLLREVARELEPLLAAKWLVLDTRLSPAAIVAKVDPLRFQQVVRNVLANAIKFAAEGTQIVLEAGFDDDGSAHISVRDHGPGIPPQELDKIFEAFVQSSGTKDGSGGTGLGLAICRAIVNAHGGGIDAENMPDGGSRFHIRLPPRVAGETRPAELAD